MSAVPLVAADFLLLAILLLGWWLWCLVQALRVPDPTWVPADQNKLVQFC